MAASDANQLGPDSTADEVLEGLDLRGKRILVTGASAGLGLETARVLAAHGAWIVGAVRNPDKASMMAKTVRAGAADSGGMAVVPLDLASLSSVRRCADSLLAAGAPFDVIIANAGIAACPFGKTEDGFEMQFGTNHLGHFVLVNRIASLLKPGSRLVNLSSASHRHADVNLDDPNFERAAYTEFGSYGRSKTANILFAVAFDARHRHRGVRATAVHPGRIRTGFSKNMTAEVASRLIASVDGSQSYQWKSVPQGAATTVWSAIVASAEAVGGQYCEDCRVAEIVRDDPTIRSGVRAYALDPQRAEALWAKSEEMVGERF
ncbi:SDR family NAD(P)-dependent oxidoreductase [Sphingobium sp. EM0848]|uniref:SDR family NAD(P)-dependent oxidoreductase n=1 Tax=Sphingobium sp. EM0848 TaxID=2743473 RepID=UPI00159CC351|nr:SDR family NAD(P)-dependent oxidoreductase [Sphingobium sp. EM0848]